MSVSLKFTEKYNPKQIEAINTLLIPTQIRRILLYGGARSGKTTLPKDYTIKRAMLYAGSKHIVLRKTERDVKGTTWLEAYLPTLKYLESQGACKIYKHPAMVEFINGSIILTGGLAASEVDKVLGIEYATIQVDEASEIAYASVLPLYTRLNDRSTQLNTGKIIVPKIIFTENPPTTNHWTYRIFILKKEYDDSKLVDLGMYGCIQMNPYDNKENLAENLMRDLESLPERSRQRFLKGEFGQMHGLVYDNFDPEKHVIDDDKIDLSKATALYRIIDFGFTNPFSCIWVAEYGDGMAIVYRDYYLRGVTVNRHADAIKKFSGDEIYEKSIADHDSEDRATLEEHGIITEPAKKNVISGIDRLYARFEANKITIARSCTHVINELYSYAWKENSTKDREVKKVNDHAMDCLRYYENDKYEDEFEFFQAGAR